MDKFTYYACTSMSLWPSVNKKAVPISQASGFFPSAIVGGIDIQSEMYYILKWKCLFSCMVSFQEYHTRLAEDARFPKSVLTVSATDADTKERGEVRYTLGGEGALLFVINETTGEVSCFMLDRRL